MHISNLLQATLENKKVFSTINSAVYFHNAKDYQIKQISKEKYTRIFNKDNLSKETLKKFFTSIWMTRKSYFFNQNTYNEIKRHCLPPIHTLEQGQNFNFTKKQKPLTQSQPGFQKIKGVAGSGKTLIMAQRAVNAYKRTSSNVLVLSYNISLKNYIHDKISSVRAEFPWEKFHISNYHSFMTSQFTNLNIYIDVPDQFTGNPIKIFAINWGILIRRK